MTDSRAKNILLVEDEAIIGMTESLQLKSYGYQVVHVLSGEKALAAIAHADPSFDLILMDIDLGAGMSGPEAVAAILAEYDIPIVFLSSHIEKDIVDKTSDMSSYGYVVKNVDITVLDASIKMAFKLHSAYTALKYQKGLIEVKSKALEYYESKYRRLFETARDGILLLNAETGIITDVNPFLIELLGFSREQFLKKHIWDISAFKYIENSKNLFKELQENEYVRYRDIPLESIDKAVIHVEFVSNVYLVNDEKIIQCNIRDIEDRMNVEKALNVDIDKKDSLLKEIQHRTKNSFAMITSLIGLRSSRAESAATKATLAELSLRVQSISDLYSLLYETHSFYEVSLKTYCTTVVDSVLGLSSGIRIEKDIGDIVVSAKSAASIGMIIVELVTNALKYAFPDRADAAAAAVTISLGLQDKRIVLVVSDNGIGMDPEEAKSKKDSIGLHLVALLVEQLNGTMEIASGKGTSTRIVI